MSEVPSDLQAERTRFSWDRTALSFAAYGALLVQASHIPGILVLFSGCAILLVGRRRYHRLIAYLRRGETIPRPWAIPYIATFTTGMTLLSAVVCFTAR